MVGVVRFLKYHMKNMTGVHECFIVQAIVDVDGFLILIVLNFEYELKPKQTRLIYGTSNFSAAVLAAEISFFIASRYILVTPSMRSTSSISLGVSIAPPGGT